MPILPGSSIKFNSVTKWITIGDVKKYLAVLTGAMLTTKGGATKPEHNESAIGFNETDDDSNSSTALPVWLYPDSMQKNICPVKRPPLLCPAAKKFPSFNIPLNVGGKPVGHFAIQDTSTLSRDRDGDSIRVDDDGLRVWCATRWGIGICGCQVIHEMMQEFIAAVFKRNATSQGLSVRDVELFSGNTIVISISSVCPDVGNEQECSDKFVRGFNALADEVKKCQAKSKRKNDSIVLYIVLAIFLLPALSRGLYKGITEYDNSNDFCPAFMDGFCEGVFVMCLLVNALCSDNSRSRGRAGYQRL